MESEAKKWKMEKGRYCTILLRLDKFVPLKKKLFRKSSVRVCKLYMDKDKNFDKFIFLFLKNRNLK